MGGYAWVTLATNDAYSLGALVLAHSLYRAGTKHELAVLVTPGVTETMREKLSAVFSVVMEVNVLDSKDEANLALLARPELGITFTKLHCWRLTQYEKCVFLDADTLVVRNCDELFEREELSAAPDVGWPDCFNSGVFVYKPSQQTFASITAFAAAKGSFDGGDQGLLNLYFSDWAHKDISKHLPFIYNMCSTAVYSYLPAFKQFGDDVRIIHFIGITKPWLQYFDTLTGIVQPPVDSVHLQPLLQLWWNIFCEKVHPQLSSVMAGLAGALAQMTLGEPRSAQQIALEEHMRKQSWEQGQIDYMGRDSFDNIWKKICQTLSLAPPRLPSPPKETQKPAETTTDKTAESIKPTESIEPIESTDETDAKAAQATTTHTDEQSLVNNVPITDSKSMIPKLSEKDEQVINAVSSASKNREELSEETDHFSQKPLIESEKSIGMLVDSPPVQLLTQTSQEEVVKLDTSSLPKQALQLTTVSTVPPNVTQTCSIKEQKLITPTEAVISNISKESDIKDDTHAKELSTASEILTISPVPIQVAESVLQAESKESMSGSQKMTSEILSTTVPSVHQIENKTYINSSGSSNKLMQNKVTLSLNNTATTKNIDIASKSNESSIKSEETSQILPQIEQIQQSTPAVTTPSTKEIESCTKEMVESVKSPSEFETTKTSLPHETPVRPSRTKELNIPSTSAKATVQDLKGQEKVTKKVVKRSAEKSASEREPIEPTEGDTAEKKVVKKAVKKVTKKAKPKSEEALDDGAENGSSNKQKKTVKVVKKGTKTSQTPGTDTVVPETSSSSTSNTPIPPKRKAKPVAKKSDVE
ncbi:glycogenin 1 isoform X2 [Osmia lignaria lignaria]|uniref:glycogenin 1 isoform X2 n=1 Tax=Osmia lignaria lignaria TaxID=1437193 RepID=UPI00402BE960